MSAGSGHGLAGQADLATGLGVAGGVTGAGG